MSENRSEPKPEKSERRWGRLIPASHTLALEARLLGYMAEREGPRPMCGRELSAAMREWAAE